MTESNTDEDGHDCDQLVEDNAPRSLNEREPQQTSPEVPVSQTNVPKICCALLASITTGGTTYAFGLYGNALKKTLHLTQSQLDTISTANFCAGLLSWIPGMIVDRFGTRLGISLGGITGAVSLMLYWVISIGYIQFEDKSWAVAMLSALGVTTFLSCALVTGSVFKIISCSCGAGTKGSAVGVAKGYVGLGAGAYACLFESIRQPTSSDLDFLPMAAFFFLVAATIPSWLVLPTKANEHTVPDVLTPLHFRVLYTSLILLALLIVGSSLANLYKEEHHEDHAQASTTPSPNYFTALVILIVWIAPIVVQFYLPQRSSVLVDVMDQEEQDALLEGEEGREDSSDLNDYVNDVASVAELFDTAPIVVGTSMGGVPSAFDRDHRQFSVARLEEALVAEPDPTPRGLAERVVAAVDAFTGDAVEMDDITCIALKRLA